MKGKEHWQKKDLATTPKAQILKSNYRNIHSQKSQNDSNGAMPNIDSNLMQGVCGVNGFTGGLKTNGVNTNGTGISALRHPDYRIKNIRKSTPLIDPDSSFPNTSKRKNASYADLRNSNVAHNNIKNEHLYSQVSYSFFSNLELIYTFFRPNLIFIITLK